MGLVVTGIKYVSTCRRFLNQLLRVRFLELGPKSKRRSRRIYHNYFDKNQTLQRILGIGIIKPDSHILVCCVRYLYWDM